MFNIDKKSIIVKLSIIMLLIIMLQSILMIGSIVASGVVQNIENSAYTSFSEKVHNRNNYFSTEMNMRWKNIDSYAFSITQNYNQIISSANDISSDNINAFLSNSAEQVIDMIRSTMTTGGFIILNNELTKTESPNYYQGLYLKDYDPFLNAEDNKDISMLNGPVEIARSNQIPLESSWSYGITLKEENEDVFLKPFEAANKFGASQNNIKLNEFGFWQIAPNVDNEALPTLTYSIPLMDLNGTIFGVLGIEVSEDVLYKILPKNEISEKVPIGYLIGKYNEEENSFTKIMSQGQLQKQIFGNNDEVKMHVKNEEHNIYTIENTKPSYEVLASLKDIKLYNPNSPYADEQWALIGLVDEPSILGFSNILVNTLITIFFVSLGIGIIIAVTVGVNFTTPIVNLAKKVKKNDPKTVVSFDRTGLREIDELSISIENLNKNILDASIKTERIIDMVNLPLATFEFDKSTEYVQVSDSMLSLLNIKNLDIIDIPTKNRVSHQLFFDKINSIKEHIEDENDNIYELVGNPSKWLKIVSYENENSVLGVVMDMTKTVLENHAIKFERDYDTLTKIYNRFAFKREVTSIFQKGIKNVSAFLMFDLDNLKYINDTHGHDSGDSYIKAAATAISTKLCKNSVVGRMSGDEFYVFLYNFSDKQEIRDMLTNMYVDFDENMHLLPNGTEFKIRMSGGLAWYGDDSTNLDELIRYSDFAMYQGKHTVKGEIREFNKEDYDKESYMFTGRDELDKIFDNQLVEFAFQPIISAKDGSIFGYESLMRPESSILSTPDKLIQLAAAQSKLWKVEKLTFFKTLSTYAKYQNLFNNCKIFINSVPSSILKEDEYREIEKLYPTVLKNIVMEIIENEKLDSNILNLKKELIKSWGASIAIDDYGAGYNGDLSLLSIKPEFVKIDRIMIEDIEKDKNRQSIIQKLMLYAKEQNILVLAEGVETYAQMKYMIEIGVDYIQGYYVAHPNFLPNFDNKKISNEILDIHSTNNQ